MFPPCGPVYDIETATRKNCESFCINGSTLTIETGYAYNPYSDKFEPAVSVHLNPWEFVTAAKSAAPSLESFYNVGLGLLAALAVGLSLRRLLSRDVVTVATRPPIEIIH